LGFVVVSSCFFFFFFFGGGCGSIIGPEIKIARSS